MDLIIASGNRGKIAEFSEMIESPITPFYELIGDLDIVEDGESFAENALIKARAIYQRLPKEAIVIADDSGISIDRLGGEPGIYSARYAKEGANDKENLQKAIESLEEKGFKESPAHYTAALAVVSKYGEYVVHGWMHGKVITSPRGDKGFGYDPIFIPNGYDKTLGELDAAVKSELSHRAKALNLIKPIITMLQGK
jgi:XTP/dITP diphosphohydrolase